MTEPRPSTLRLRVPQAHIVALWTIVVLAALSVPFLRVDIGFHPAFLPAVLTLVAASDVLTAFLLYQQFLSGGRGRYAGFATAYLFSAFAIVPHALAFPGLVTKHGPLAVTASAAPWTWTFWHIGFAVLLTASCLCSSFLQRCTVTRRRRQVTVLASVVLATSSALGIAVGMDHWGTHLPVVMHGLDYSRLAHLAGWAIVGTGVAAVAATLWSARGRRGIDGWIAVSAIAALAEVTLILLAQTRPSFGWHAGRALSGISVGVVLAALQVELSRLYRRAENANRVLEDEALLLLREKRAAQYREDRVRRIIENAADGYVEIDVAGLVTAWNGKAAEMFDWRADEAVGRPFVELVMAQPGHAELHAFIDELWNAGDRSDGRRAELIVMTSDEVEFPVEVTTWVDESDVHPRMNFFLRDITSRRALDEQMQLAFEEQRQAVLRLQEIDRVKSDFVSSVSHELRSPLTSTLGYLELLADGDAGALNDEQAHMVEVAERNAKRLFGLIEDLLTLSRIEEGAFSVHFRPVEIGDVVRDGVSNSQVAAAARGVSLVVDTASALGVFPADVPQITRAIGNVVGNAVKFTPPDGEVRVSAQRGSQDVTITVTDTGIGIPLEEQSKLFSRFFRSSLAVEQQYQGAGLGLTIAKAIVEHHGGTITVHSVVGTGTTVSMTLPALPVTTVQPAGTAASVE